MGLDKTRKIIVILLVLAILFSLVSIFINLGVFNVSPSDDSSDFVRSSSGGQVILNVEDNNIGGNS